MDFLGIGPLELVIIALIAFLVLGPRRMTDVGRKLGRGMREVRKIRSELTSALEEVEGEAGVKEIANIPSELTSAVGEGEQEVRRVGSEISRSLEEKPQPPSDEG